MRAGYYITEKKTEENVCVHGFCLGVAPSTAHFLLITLQCLTALYLLWEMYCACHPPAPTARISSTQGPITTHLAQLAEEGEMNSHLLGFLLEAAASFVKML